MSEIIRCPFCGEDIMYKVERVDFLGTVIPQLFCNSCKMIFEIENDSPYLDDKKTEVYLKEKLYTQFNTRKPMERILTRLKEARAECKELQRTTTDAYGYMKMKQGIDCGIDIVKEVGGIE